MSFKYWAFISYNHKDEKQSKWLHRAIENYRVPKHLIGKTIDGQVIPKKITPVFRDRDELPASSDLNNSIKEALRNSRTLVVLSSPSAAKSKWVNEEIRVFKSFGENQRVLTTILDGEPNVSDKEDESKEECFPEALKYKVDTHGQISEDRVEPIAADLRPGKDGKLNTKLKTIAGILGVSFDELKRRDQRRRVIRNSWLAATVSVILVTIALLATMATEQSHKALANKIAGMQTLANEYLSAEAIPEGLTILAEIAKISDGQSKDQALLSASYLLSRLLSIEDILENAPSDSLVFEWRKLYYYLEKNKKPTLLAEDKVWKYWIDKKKETLLTIEYQSGFRGSYDRTYTVRSLNSLEYLHSGFWENLNFEFEAVEPYSISFPFLIRENYLWLLRSYEEALVNQTFCKSNRAIQEEIKNNIKSIECIKDFIEGFSPVEQVGFSYDLTENQLSNLKRVFATDDNYFEYVLSGALVSNGQDLFIIGDSYAGTRGYATSIWKVGENLQTVANLDMVNRSGSWYEISSNGNYLFCINPEGISSDETETEIGIGTVMIYDLTHRNWTTSDLGLNYFTSSEENMLFCEGENGFIAINQENVLLNFALTEEHKIVLENSFHISDEYIAKDAGEEGCEESWGIGGKHMKRQLEYISDDIALLASKGHKITAVDLNTGHILWSKKNPLNLEKCDLHKDLNIVSDIEAGIFAIYSEKRARIYSSIYGTPITGIINVDLMDISMENGGTEKDDSQSIEYQDEQSELMENIFFLKNGSFLLKTTHSYYLSFPPFSKEETMEMLRNIGKYTGLKYKDELETLKILPGVQPNKEFMTEIEN